MASGSMDPAVAELAAIARVFGRGAAGTKLRLLSEIAGRRRLGARTAAALAGTLEFLRAYPDDPRVARAVGTLIPVLPETDIVYEYSYAVVRRLLPLLGERMEIAWDEFDDDGTLLEGLDLITSPADADGLADPRLTLQQWFAIARPAGGTDLGFLVGLLERSGLPEPVRVHLFESADVPVRYRGPRPADLRLPVARIHFQRRPVARERFRLPRFIREPVGSGRRGGGAIIDLALQALCARRLEIYPLIYGSPEDVRLVDVGRGVCIVLIGVAPSWRSSLETLFFFLIAKNGVPVAYGPAAVFDGCCEMGINLFPEFRGAEIRFLYGQLMRVLHHRLGADYFFLTRYGMGEGNEDALRSGAFWFYRKLGFRPTSATVEELARAEEARMRARPGHRSDLRMLRRLSRTEAYLDLSRGEHRPQDFARLSAAATHRLGSEVDRAAATRSIASRLGRRLGIPGGSRALRSLAPLLDLIPDLEEWSRADRERLAHFVLAKDAASEARSARLSRLPRLRRALRRIGKAVPAAERPAGGGGGGSTDRRGRPPTRAIASPVSR